MAIKGRLSEMSLPVLVQLTCNEGDMARLNVRQGEEEGVLYFEGGNIVHAVLGAQTGEEAVYELLTWEDGEFELESDISPPERTITVSWSGLLLEGMRRIDEHTAAGEGVDTLLFEEQPEEVHEMVTMRRADRLAEALTEAVENSADIDSGAVVGTDGLVLSAVMTGKLDETLFGAQAAALYGIAKRTSSNLGRGSLFQAVIQSDKGNIIVYTINESTLFIGATGKDVNLGMLFMDAREFATEAAAILGG